MNSLDNLGRKLFMAFGLTFLAIGAVAVIISLSMNARMNNSRQVSATVVEVIKEVDRSASVHNDYGHLSVLYTPVYEYTDGGEVIRYTSNVSTSKRAEIGSQATLYISEDGKIYQKSGAAVTLFVGIIFAVVGGVFTFITFKLWKKKTEEAEERYL